MYAVNHEEAEYQLTDWQDEKINIDGISITMNPLLEEAICKLSISKFNII
jgi:hypothetical protein